MLEFKAKYQKKKSEWMYFIKNKEYKCIWGKSMPPYTNLSLFLIISSKNYISDPNILTKGAATVVFVRRVAQGSSFKKDSQFNPHFCICTWCCGCALHKLFSVIRQIAIILKAKTQFFLFHTRKKKIFKSFLFCGICKSRLYSVNISTDIPILDSLLVHVY